MTGKEVAPLRASAINARYKLQDGKFESTTLDRLRAKDILDGAPVRVFRAYKHRKHYSGYYWAATTKKFVVYESLLEKSFLMLADFDPSVTAMAAQPIELTRTVGRNAYTRVPDFMVQYRTGAIRIVDVKPARRLDDPKIAGPLEWTRRAVEAHGWEYEVWSEPSTAVRLMNIQHLAGYRRSRLICPDMVDAVRSAVCSEISIRSLEYRLCAGYERPHALVRPAVLHLLWTGALTADLDQMLRGDSLLRAVAA